MTTGYQTRYLNCFRYLILDTVDPLPVAPAAPLPAQIQTVQTVPVVQVVQPGSPHVQTIPVVQPGTVLIPTTGGHLIGPPAPSQPIVVPDKAKLRFKLAARCSQWFHL